MSSLNPQQQDIFNKYISGENIFITGAGGTGKTHLIKTIVAHAKENNKAYKVCALTGCAAILLQCGASTLHAFAGIGLATGTVSQVIDRVVKNKHRRPNWQKTDILIVDEVSMLSLKLFTILDFIAKRIKKLPNTPFGGMQIIFAGDFYQLPPVGEESDPDTQNFCFESPLWNETFTFKNQIALQTIFRQTDDLYVKILNKLRVGKITKGAIATLESCVGKKISTDILPTILLPRRRDADALNSRELALLDKETEKSFKVKQVPEAELPLTKSELQNLSLFTEKEIEFETGYLMDNIMAEKDLKLRKGAVVMCIANLNVESHRPIINGSQGVVIDYVDGYPLVKFGEDITEVIGPHTWSSERIPGIAVKQLPLIYAWAVTIHKAQGLTLDRALIDIGGNIFECGQTYVALSRVKSLEGLHLKSFDFTKIKINKKVQMFYKQLALNNLSKK
jgi:ATP-dependent DNA helicase PIF1